MSEIDFHQSSQGIFFQGELTRDTINLGFERKTLNLFSTSSLAIDLESVSHIDTAGLAWLLMMVEKAKQKKCQLIIQKPPKNLLNLAKLSAVDGFLPLEK